MLDRIVTSSSVRPVPVPLPGSSELSPGSRDVFLDVLRVAALAIVVVWHWVFTTVAYTSEGVSVDNPVASVRWLWVLTWVAQPMCVFFAVGGFLHSRDRRPAAVFWSARLRRLVVPALPLVAAAVVLWGLFSVSGRAGLADAVVLAVSPLWFLLVYVVLVLAAPLAKAAHARFGFASVVVLAAVVALVDVLRFAGRLSGWGPVGLLFLVTWGCVHQLGFFLDRFRNDRRFASVAVLVGLCGLVGLSSFGPYPLAMVGNSADTMSNMGPPNLMVVCLAVLQLGVLGLVAAPISRFAQRHRAGLVFASRWSMPVFVWHLTAFCVFFAAASAAGLDNAVVDGSWWLTRPVWLLGPAVVFAAAVWCAARIRRAGPGGAGV